MKYKSWMPLGWAVMLLLFALPAFAAGVAAPRIDSSGACADYQIPYCTNAANCQMSSSDAREVYIPNNSAGDLITIMEDPATHGGAATYTCEIRFGPLTEPSDTDTSYTNLRDYNSGAAITWGDTQENIMFSGNMIGIWWVHCSAVTNPPAAFRVRVCNK